MPGKVEGRRRGQQRMRWLDGHHRLKGHVFEQAPGDGKRQGSLKCTVPGVAKVVHDLENVRQQLYGEV